MSALQQSASYTQDYPLSLSYENTTQLVKNDQVLVEQQVQPALRPRLSRLRSESTRKILLASSPLHMYSESLFQYDPLLFEILFSHTEAEAFCDIKISPVHSRTSIFYEKPLIDITYEIIDIYSERQKGNWDGYGAEPIKYLSQSLQFAEDLFLESMSLIESVDIIPENDGCLCFEWFKSDNKLISISVGRERFAYNYKLGDEEACGEISFSSFLEKQMLIKRIKRIA